MLQDQDTVTIGQRYVLLNSAIGLATFSNSNDLDALVDDWKTHYTFSCACKMYWQYM